MAKLYFRYGAMNSGKTANLLMVADNYINQGKEVLILKPASDTRWEGVKSRAVRGTYDSITVAEDGDVFALVKASDKKLYSVLVDEAQFFSPEQVEQMARVVDELGIPVLCYGLRSSYVKGLLFPGSEALFYWADTIEEIKNVCYFCNKKATHNLLKRNGVPVYEGTPVVMGDVEPDDTVEEVFTAVCRKHYHNPA